MERMFGMLSKTQQRVNLLSGSAQCECKYKWTCNMILNYVEWGIPQEMAMDEAILKSIQEWNDV